MNNRNSPAVRLEALSRKFDGETAVDNLTFTVDDGEIFALTGPDGAGKTTTCRLLAGVLEPSSGSGTILGMDILTEPESIKKRIGYLPDRSGLYDDLSVMENLRFYSDIYNVPPAERSERIDELLTTTELTSFTDRLAGNLSGGMRQKLNLSCVLLSEPDVLIMDEPTRGVDPVSRRDLWELFYEYHREGITLVLSTVSLPEADRSTRVGFLESGKLIEEGTPTDLKQGLDRTVLRVRIERPRSIIQPLRSRFPETQVNLFGSEIHLSTKDPEGIEASIQNVLDEQNVSGSVKRIEPSLDDVFIARSNSGAVTHREQ